jgi:phosphoribosylformylglycinamidine cyclo-ligase
MATQSKSAYAQAGVNIDNKMSALTSIKTMVAGTKTPLTLGGIGSFGGLHKVPQGKDQILVSSTDGVGTKLKIAAMMNKHDTVGQDIVNHCVNDILVQGAKPLFFMDYVGAAKFDGPQFKQIVSGLCKACKENKMALLGGETAEMPGLYPVGEYDLVGTIVGHVSKKDLITGKSIRAGDVIVGLPSGGLQTNGFSLARRVIFDLCQYSWKDKLPGTNQTFGDALLAVHKSFLKPVSRLMDLKVKINGMAHITGGGFPDNLPRVLPKCVNAEIDRSSWDVPTIFKFIERQGKVSRDEMYRVFNMGIGFVIVIPKTELKRLQNCFRAIRQPYSVIGVIRKGTGVVTYKD